MLVTILEKTKTFTGWSEAECIQKLCKYLESKGQASESDWEFIADDMLKKLAYNSHDNFLKHPENGWMEHGNGFSSHGSEQYTFKLELLDTCESKKNKFWVECKFYIYIAESQEQIDQRTKVS